MLGGLSPQPVVFWRAPGAGAAFAGFFVSPGAVRNQANTPRGAAQQEGTMDKQTTTTTANATNPNPTKKLAPLPALPKAARKAAEKHPCACGCGFQTSAQFVPGHDSRLRGWVIRLARKAIEPTAIPDGERQVAEKVLRKATNAKLDIDSRLKVSELVAA